METYWVYSTDLGPITIACEGEGVTALRFGERPMGQRMETELGRRAFDQLQEYLAGQRRDFDLPLCPKGTEFQRKVWRALGAIPYGQIRTYGEVAAQVGKPKACRAVGMANNRNPIAIVVPCHRVVGANGTLTGYAGGLDIKAKLLELEGN